MINQSVNLWFVFLETWDLFEIFYPKDYQYYPATILYTLGLEDVSLIVSLKNLLQLHPESFHLLNIEHRNFQEK